jgi:hypothetical protein
MNTIDQKNEVVNKVVGEATERMKEKDAPEENVQLILQDGVVYASLDGLITNFKINSKRKGLSKAEIGIFSRVVNNLETFRAVGLKNLKPTQVVQTQQPAFWPGQQVEYIGGQIQGGIDDKFKLQTNVVYHVFDNRKGVIADQWVPVITLEEFPGENPDQRPGFMLHLFKAYVKPAAPEAPVIQMGAQNREVEEELENDLPGPETGKDSPYS